MMGFAGQLSLGHALYVGLGAYAAAVLFMCFGIGPGSASWSRCRSRRLRRLHRLSGLPLSRRRRLFRHPDHRLRRIRPHRLRSFRPGSAPPPACSCRSRNMRTTISWQLRGHPAMFYYVILAARPCCVRALAALLLPSRVGYFWLAIREDEEAARSAGIDVPLQDDAVVISAAMTSFAGVFYAFYYNNLFPEQVFDISRSIEIILGPIVGGVGTLFGPILGAFVLTGLGETLTAAQPRSASICRAPSRCSTASACSSRHGAAGRRVAVAADAARARRRRAMSALLSVNGVSKRFRGLVAVDRVSFEVPEGGIFAVIGPNGAGKTTLFNMIAGVFGAERRNDRLRRRAHRRPAARPHLPARHRPHLPDRAAVSGAQRRGQCHRRRAAASPACRRRARARARRAAPARPLRQARPARLVADAARPQAAGSGARARDRSASCCCSTR